MNRRRHVAATGAVIAVVATIAVVPSLFRGALHPEPAGVGRVLDELALHGGPCPAVLPRPEDDGDGHGFGTPAFAEEKPQYAEPDGAWICQYQTRGLGRAATGGTSYEWARMKDPRRLADIELDRLQAALDGVRVDRTTKDCDSDLGPTWLLVTSTGDDLTGTAVQDFGCRAVRLTGDPFVAAPGDPYDGIGAGVLSGPDDLVGDLRGWWDTSPTVSVASTAPDELRVTCTDQGPQIGSPTVAAQNGGVVLVVDSALGQGSYLTYTSEGGPAGGDPAEGTTTYPFPPGTLTLSCATPPGMDEIGSATVEVLDPYGYWRDETLEQFGCRASAGQPSWVAGLVGTGSTAAEAVQDTMTNLGPGHTAEPAPTGYSGAATQTWVVSDDGVPALSVAVTRTAHGFRAYPDVLCADE